MAVVVHRDMLAAVDDGDGHDEDGLDGSGHDGLGGLDHHLSVCGLARLLELMRRVARGRDRNIIKILSLTPAGKYLPVRNRLSFLSFFYLYRHWFLFLEILFLLLSQD